MFITKEHVQDEVIFRHLKTLSNEQLDITGVDSLEKSKIYHSGNNPTETKIRTRIKIIKQPAEKKKFPE